MAKTSSSSTPVRPHRVRHSLSGHRALLVWAAPDSKYAVIRFTRCEPPGFFYAWRLASAYLPENACLSNSDDKVLSQMWQAGRGEHFVWRARDCDHGVIWSPGGNKDSIWYSGGYEWQRLSTSPSEDARKAEAASCEPARDQVMSGDQRCCELM